MRMHCSGAPGGLQRISSADVISTANSASGAFGRLLSSHFSGFTLMGFLSADQKLVSFMRRSQGPLAPDFVEKGVFWRGGGITG